MTRGRPTPRDRLARYKTLVAQGRSREEIAAYFSITLRSVDYLKELLQKDEARRA